MKTIKIKNIEIKKGIPKICVSLMGKNEKEIMSNLDVLMQEDIDVVEWRIDDIEKLNKDSILSIGKKIQEKVHKQILLFTIRTKQEGGNMEIKIEQYEDFLTAVIDAKLCDMIDIEMFKNKTICMGLCRKAQYNQIYVVGSTHNFRFTESKEDLKEVFIDLMHTGVDVCKVARMPNTKEDVTNLMYATKEVSKQYPTSLLVGISMGELGKISRIEGELFDSVFTFACLQQASAPGQIEVKEMRNFLLEVHKKNNTL